MLLFIKVLPFGNGRVGSVALLLLPIIIIINFEKTLKKETV